MKKAICILMSIVMVLCLAGCSTNISAGEVKQPIRKEALNSTDLSELGSISIIDYTIEGSLIAILYTPFISEDILMADDGNYDYKSFLTVFDTKQKKLAKSIETDVDSYIVKFVNGNIQVWNDISDSVIYDKTLNEIGRSRSIIPDGYEIASDIDTIDTSSFVCRDSYSYINNYICNNVTIFYDDPENYYISKTEQSSFDLSGYKKTILSYVNNDDKNVTLSVADYENKKIINEISLTSENEEYLSITRGIIDKNYAVFDTTKSDGSFDKLYYWNYNELALNKPFECIEVNKSEFYSKTKAISEEIYKKYGVYAAVNKEFSGVDYGYECADTEKDARYLLCLYDLDYCLSTFPKELYKEILCNDVENAITEFNKMKFCITGTIDDNDVSAFATNENDDLIIVYSASSFSYSTFCHEIMHQLEYRIWNYEDDFDYKWEQLNPDEFYYTDDYSSAYYENEQYQDYFARDYGISNSLEDRATVFEMYYDAIRTGGEKWWLEHKPLNDKLNYLNETLAKSFPSLNK